MDIISTDQIEVARELIEEVGATVRAEQEEDIKSGRRFNVFIALGRERAELTHSRFLACLLDPKGIHDQSALFLRTFLIEILHELGERSDLSESEVLTETNIQNGRLNIRIILPDGQIVVLENKIGAGEGPDQLGRYRRWLAGKPPSKSGRPHYLVFLTPDARLPSSCNSTDMECISLKCISYKAITDWLDNLRSKVPDALRLIIEQYITLWRAFPMNTQMLELLRDSRNYDAAEYISQAVRQVREEAKKQFLDLIQQDLKGRLEAIHLDSNWNAVRTPNTEKFSGCGLLWKRRNRDLLNQDLSQQQFTVLCEAQDSNWNDLIVGICRGAEVEEDRQAEQDKDISRRLMLRKDQRFRPSKWWAGYVKLMDLAGRRTIGIKDLVLEGHQISKLVADELWKLFETYRKELEDLNRSYSYPCQIRILKEDLTG